MSESSLIYFKCDGLDGQCTHSKHDKEFLLGGHDADTVASAMQSAREATGHYIASQITMALSTVAGTDAADVESETLKTASGQKKIFPKATITHFEVVNGAQQATQTYTLENVTVSSIPHNQYAFLVNFSKYTSKKQGYNPDGTVRPSNPVWFDTKTNTSSFMS